VFACEAVHHLPAGRHAAVIRSVAKVVRLGGIVLVKDHDTDQAWKYRWNRFHDRLVAGPDPICCRPPENMAALLIDAGLDVDCADRIDHGFTPYAVYLVRARKPK
jgi:hypothetical protein